MKHKWNDALVAYERDYELIEEVRSTYIELLGHLIEQVAVRVRRRSQHELEVTRQEHTAAHYAQLKVEGEAIAVIVWPARPSGGPVGCVRVGIYLMNACAAREAMPDELAVIVNEAKSALGELVRDEQLKGADLSDDDMVLLAVRSFDLAADDVEEALSVATVEYCRAAERAARAVAELEQSTPLLWLRRVLGELLAADELDKVLEAGGGCRQRKLSKWPTERDRYFPVGADGIDSLWIMTQAPGGRVSFCLSKRSGEARTLHGELCSHLGAAPFTFNGYFAGELLSEERIAELYRERDSAPLIARLSEAWTAYAKMVNARGS